MILSTEDSAIIEYEFIEHGTKCCGTKIVHCKEGDEEKCLQKMDRRLKKATVTSIKRNGKIV